MPKRFQSRRITGWRKPPGSHVVSRSSIFGNPFIVGSPGIPDRATAVRLYESALLNGTLTGYKRPNLLITIPMIQAKFRGCDLGCPCELNGEPCHADVLLKYANM